MMRPSSTRPNRARMDRRIRRSGTYVLGLVAILIPSLYIFFAVNGLGREARVETRFLAREAEHLIQDRPELWPYETLRLREMARNMPIEELDVSRRFIDGQGHILAENDARPPWPRFREEAPIFDSGRQVAMVITEHPLRPLLQRGLFLALACLLAATGGVLWLRALPLRFIDDLLDELHEERERSDAILLAIPEGVVTVDSEKRVLRLNPAAESMLGMSNRQALGRALDEVYPVRRESLGGGHGDRILLRDPEGGTRILEDRSFVIPLHDSEKPGEVILFRDITDRVRADTELLRARQIDSLGVLAGGIAHDFNNFLGAILGNVSLAREKLGRESDVTERLDMAIQATDRAKQTALRLLAFAKGGEPTRTVLDVRSLVKEAVGFTLQGSGVLCSYQFAADLWSIEGDSGLLTQVLNNLVINAKQALGDRGNLRISAENAAFAPGQIPFVAAGRFVVIHVEDSGPGVPEAIRHRVFEPYFTTKEGGSGLGLATAYKILKAHDGNIFVRSSALGGAHFLLYLPASSRAVVPADLERPESSRVSGQRVLVMDDDPIILDTCRQILEHYGFEVGTAPEGRRAADIYLKARGAGRPFNVVILDLTVPGGLGGRETARLILDYDPGALLIASSGYSDDPIMARPMDFGFRVAIPKPYSAPELLRCVQDTLEGVKA